MSPSRRTLLKALAAPFAVLAAGCYGPDNPKVAEAPAFKPTEKEKELPKGMPPGYGQGAAYKKAMEEMERNTGR